jgi:hypothetical protein
VSYSAAQCSCSRYNTSAGVVKKEGGVWRAKGQRWKERWRLGLGPGFAFRGRDKQETRQDKTGMGEGKMGMGWTGRTGGSEPERKEE